MSIDCWDGIWSKACMIPLFLDDGFVYLYFAFAYLEQKNIS